MVVSFAHPRYAHGLEVAVAEDEVVLLLRVLDDSVDELWLELDESTDDVVMVMKLELDTIFEETLLVVESKLVVAVDDVEAWLLEDCEVLDNWLEDALLDERLVEVGELVGL